ncbi:alpha-1,2-fucosyltransferase [Segetibacter sp. 3557_3]|uniref:alpha-1,2-fucosyltransferase n=1 Tax=Segetibacter sp. 3557_3 TaxID=2547429 RepID=UPI001058589A|nr:alpha-1,2-fucosyltransferase [Segetibacter sp. 3557_3]TDH21591.1 alpha-1,2-fucosyltransferase [Segetibacter sp. 3557_3]
MIGVKLNGRLGNQLFQYAFAYSIAKKLNTPFYLDTQEQILIDRYFDVPLPLFNRFLKLLEFRGGHKVRLAILRAFQKRFKTVTFPDAGDPRELLGQVEDDTFYEGFFQSRTFFREYEQEIIARFQIKKPFRINPAAHFEQGYASILVHVRRTDYLNIYFKELNTTNVALSKEYFYKGLDHLTASIKSNYKIYVISDDINLVKQEFLDIPHEVKYLQNAFVVDLQLIMNADYLVISNSSFSWWGAFLNTKVKQVVAPKYWCGVPLQKYHPLGIAERLAWEWI